MTDDALEAHRDAEARRTAEIASARADTQERREAMLREADDLFRRANHAQEVRIIRAANGARNALRDFTLTTRVREDAAHDGIDRTIDAAHARLAATLRTARADLSGGELDTATLERLAALWTATTHEGFAATLHELLEAPDHPGHAPMSRLTGEQVQQRRALAREHEQTISAANERARGHVGTTAQQRTAADLNGHADLDAARAAADAAEAAADDAETALGDLRAALDPEREG